MDLNEMTTMYQNYLYSGALKELVKTKIDRYRLETRDSPEVMAETLIELSKLTKPTIKEPAKNFSMEYVEELDNRQHNKPVKIGLSSLDYILGGLRPDELTSIGARPSVGKSAFMLQTAINVSKKVKVLYFPLEMSKIQTYERIVQSKARILQEHLRNGELTENEWEDITFGVETLDEIEKQGNFLMFEGVNNLTEIKALVDKYEPYAIFIDQLTQLRDYKRFKDKREQFSYMTSELKRLSMDKHISVVLACQVNRDAQNAVPTMANLKESGSIEEDSDNIILLHRCKDGDMTNPTSWSDERRPIEVMVEKQRNGGTGKVLMSFFTRQFTFYEMEF